jgi:CRISPR type III-B/RAMP module-associated protein Cmr5
MMTEQSHVVDIRAERAYECAKKGKCLKNESKEYRSRARRLPILIHNAGLIAAVAFAKDKGGEAWKLLLAQLREWLAECELVSAEDELLGQLVRLTSPDYRLVVTESLLFCQWLSRFASGMIAE